MPPSTLPLQMSNLVLASKKTAPRGGPSGAAESLAKKGAFPFGDRARPDKPDLPQASVHQRGGGGTGANGAPFDHGLEDDPLAYRPRTRETRDNFAALLSALAQHLGAQPSDVLRGAADEVLAALRTGDAADRDRRREVESLLGKVDETAYARLQALSRAAVDWAPEEDRAGGAIAADGAGGADGGFDRLGVAVDFENEDEEVDPDAVMAEEVDEGTDASGESDGAPPRRPAQAGSDADGDGDGDNDGGAGAGPSSMRARGRGDDDKSIPIVDPREVDAYWLQRRVAESDAAGGDATGTAEEAQALAAEVLSLLSSDAAAAEVESGLVALLGLGRFALIRELASQPNRDYVVWGSKRARAAGDEEVARVDAAMPARVLALLRGKARGDARERRDETERAIRDEAAGLGGGAAKETKADGTAGELLDLSSLEFAKGGHLMANKTCALPEGSFRVSKKGYEEVHVPAPGKPPARQGEVIVRIDEMPEWARAAFAGMTALNRVQSRIYQSALFSAENLLLCAPTGAGKTNVAVLSILQALGAARDPHTGEVDKAAFKCVYVAPMKALVAEVVGNLRKRIGEPYSLEVIELTGDSSASRIELAAAQIIVVTPEKWDIVTRNAGDAPGGRGSFADAVRLVVLDEVHLLHDSRGPVLESIVARTVRGVEASGEMVRIVGLSATLPNDRDVASFLRVDPDKGLFVFDGAYRPCPLQQQFVGITVRKPLQRRQLLDQILFEKIAERAGKHQIIVFVHSRKDTAATARTLRDTAMEDGEVAARLLPAEGASQEILKAEAEECQDSSLRALLPSGLAIHHAGLGRADRQLVEDLFADGHIQVLVSTATLAWGVNLPAHTVIIKGTEVYSPEAGGWASLSMLDLLQMLGRAGRPQYDTEGEGIVLTSHGDMQFYLSLMNEQLPVESQLVSRLPDALLAEICLGTVSSVAEGAHWLGYSYLYSRMLAAPSLYGVPVGEVDDDPELAGRRVALAKAAAAALARARLVRWDPRSGALRPTDLGRVASRFYVTHTTMATFHAHLRPSMGDIDIMRVFALADEFAQVVVREEERGDISRLLERVPIPVKESAEDPAAKINVLLQAHVSRLPLGSTAVGADVSFVTQSAARLMRCLFEICLRRGWAPLADKTLALSIMVQRRLWGSQTPLRQFPGVPADVCRKVERKDLPWARLYDLTAAELGELVRAPKLGRPLARLVRQFPRVVLEAHVQPVTRTTVRIDLSVTPDFEWDDAAHGTAQRFWVLAEDADGDTLLHWEPLVLRRYQCGSGASPIDLSFVVPVGDPAPPQCFVRVVSDSWLGSESTLPVSFRRLVLPAKFPPPTALLDLQPLPVASLKLEDARRLFEGQGFHRLNPVQTQAYAALALSDGSCLVCAPGSSGLTACAELAVLRAVESALESGSEPRCVAVAATEEAADALYAAWTNRLGGMGLDIGRLNTGSAASDCKVVGASHVSVVGPAAWDAASRRWRRSRAISELSLLVVLGLHTVGATGGHLLEAGVSRTRAMSAETGRPLRVVGLASPIANARDVAEWIGATPSSTFAFPPGARPIPLDVVLRGSDLSDPEARQRAALKPAHDFIAAEVSAGDPAIVFVPSRRHSRAAAMELLTLVAAAGEPTRYLALDGGQEALEVDPLLTKVKDRSARHCLMYGVGLVHETSPPDEREAVLNFFRRGICRVLVASAGVCWALPGCRAPTIVIAGTQGPRPGAGAAADLPVVDLLQMLSKAGRPGVDSSCRALVCCPAPRREYYRKFMSEPLPVESHLDSHLHDLLVREVASRAVASRQDAMDWLTWTLFFRRLGQNPNYYGLSSSSHEALADHLSELVETTVADLAAEGCVTVVDDDDEGGGGEVGPSNLGLIAAHHDVAYATVAMMASSLDARTKLRGLLEVICAASELADDLAPARSAAEEAIVRKLIRHAPLVLGAGLDGSGADGGGAASGRAKAGALVMAHLSRSPLPGGAYGDLAADQRTAIVAARRLAHAAVDVLASAGWLGPCVAAMELSQMLVQGMWDRDPALLQLPGFDAARADACHRAGVRGVFDLLDLEDSDRDRLLDGFSDSGLADVAAACNRYPDIHVSFTAGRADDGLASGTSITAAGEGDALQVSVDIEREWDEDKDDGHEKTGTRFRLPAVIAPRYPRPVEEGWWVAIGDPTTDQILAVRRLSIGRSARAKLAFAAPPADPDGKPRTLQLLIVCDSYLGDDQQYDISLGYSAGLSAGAAERMDQDNDDTAAIPPPPPPPAAGGPLPPLPSSAGATVVPPRPPLATGVAIPSSPPAPGDEGRPSKRARQDAMLPAAPASQSEVMPLPGAPASQREATPPAAPVPQRGVTLQSEKAPEDRADKLPKSPKSPVSPRRGRAVTAVAVTATSSARRSRRGTEEPDEAVPAVTAGAEPSAASPPRRSRRSTQEPDAVAGRAAAPDTADAPGEAESATMLMRLKKAELQERCRVRGLNDQGTKSELVARLTSEH